MTTVVLYEPDHQAHRVAVAALRFAGYSVAVARSLTHTRSLVHRRRPVAAIVDPSGDVDAVSGLRAVTAIPIIVVSPSADVGAKVAMLDAGADDYLTKPYGIEELLARIRVGLRRHHREEEATDLPPITTVDFTVDVPNRRWLRVDGMEVRLTPTEWRIIEMLARRAGRLVTRAELLRGVWGPEAADKSEYLRVYLTGIRHKVEPDPARPRYFITAPGLGLRFDPEAGQLSPSC
jgi:two-component system KDP operon response regulator KdpE